MCKLFAISKTDDLSRKQLDLVLRRLNNRFQETEPHGFGWSLAPQRQLSSAPHPAHMTERFVAPASFGGLDGGIRVYDDLPDEEADMLDVPDAEYRPKLPAAFQPSGPLIVHGRNASAGSCISIDNVHPFTKQGWTMAHNGFVEDQTYTHVTELETDCDSEILLNHFVFGKGPVDFAENVRGRYAVLALSPDNKLHVAKNHLTNLWTSRDDALGWVFATDPRDLFSVLKLLKRPRPVPVPVANHRHVVLRDKVVVSAAPIGIVPAIPPLTVTTYAQQGANGWRHNGTATRGAY